MPRSIATQDAIAPRWTHCDRGGRLSRACLAATTANASPRFLLAPWPHVRQALGSAISAALLPFSAVQHRIDAKKRVESAGVPMAQSTAEKLLQPLGRPAGDGGGGGGGLVRKQSGYMRFCNKLFAEAKEQVGWHGAWHGVAWYGVPWRTSSDHPPDHQHKHWRHYHQRPRHHHHHRQRPHHQRHHHHRS